MLCTEHMSKLTAFRIYEVKYVFCKWIPSDGMDLMLHLENVLLAEHVGRYVDVVIDVWHEYLLELGRREQTGQTEQLQVVLVDVGHGHQRAVEQVDGHAHGLGEKAEPALDLEIGKSPKLVLLKMPRLT